MRRVTPLDPSRLIRGSRLHHGMLSEEKFAEGLMDFHHGSLATTGCTPDKVREQRYAIPIPEQSEEAPQS